MNQQEEKAKRLLDLALAGGGLAALWPLLLLLSVAVKLDSPGPAFYGHERVGRGWSRFKVWKFRTMVTGADRAGAAVTAGGDPRITRLGRLLRKTKLDELPQLWNVLVGEMSMVGPRPEAPRYAEAYREAYDEILSLRPGITDEAAITYRNEEEVLAAAEDPEAAYLEEVLPKKIELYREYLEEHSLAGDLELILRTLRAVVNK
ncbi:MAG: sugar transferase [Deltaproteobacteria bacterium]|nr:sugar transferase [Deltaproteobacteria bacterium]